MNQDSHDVAVLHGNFSGIGEESGTHTEAVKKRAAVDTDDTKAIRVQ